MKNSNTHFFSLSGRLDKQSYTRRYFAILVLTVCIVGHIGLTGLTHAPSMEALVAMIAVIWGIFHFTLWIQVVKRLHDQGKEGTMAMLTFIPVFGLVYALVQTFIKGMDTVNAYGDVPDSDVVRFNTELRTSPGNAHPIKMEKAI